ncbi:hypothetical protein Pyn_40510 [Prunus yedoensis var. nudiflora]|uniref:Uncharacterized protein n=1 Tax=Prunus yedoensis var. nudiflora TaxID=2094558 RepID=A0A314UP53_PRUYE|nr:hypothetical protein Pyn_40510 [Prunus yedoensis var. nudiflora]
MGTIEVPVYGHNIGNEDRIEVPVNVDDEEDSEEDFDSDGRGVRDLQDSGDESDKDNEIYESDNDAAISRPTPLIPTARPIPNMQIGNSSSVNQRQIGVQDQ